MIIIYGLIYLYDSELIYQLSNDKNHGVSKYPIGTSIFMNLMHVMVLVNAIWLFGWGAGIGLFIAYVLSIPHLTISWIFSLPSTIQILKAQQDTLSINPVKNVVLQSHERRIAALNGMVLVSTVFLITAFILFDFREFLSSERLKPAFLTCFTVLLTVFTVLRFFLGQKYFRET